MVIKVTSLTSIEPVEDNLIYSLKFDLQLTTGNNDFLSISDVEGYCEESALPVIEGIIDDYGYSNDVIVDSMTLELGDVSKDDFKMKLERTLREKLRTLPMEGVQSTKFSDRTFNNTLSSTPLTTESVVNSRNALFPETVSSHRNQAFFMDYLVNETIPWIVEAQDFVSSRFISESIKYILGDASMFEQVVSLLRSNKAAAVRFVMESGIEDIIAFAERFRSSYGECEAFQGVKSSFAIFLETILGERFQLEFGEITDETSEMVRRIAEKTICGNRHQKKSGAVAEETSELAKKIAEQTHNSPEYETIAAILRTVIRENAGLSWLIRFLCPSDSFVETANLHAGTMDSGESYMLENEEGNIVRIAVLSLLQGEQILSDFLREVRIFFEESIEKTTGIISVDDQSGPGRSTAKGASILRDSAKTELDKVCLDVTNSITNSLLEKVGRIHVFDAGLILLHPFLPSFFHRVGLLDEHNKFASMEKRHRAVHLLRYLAGEQLGHDSAHLTLEKMICGIPLNALIGNSFEVSDAEKEEMMGLFDAVREHWKPMKKSSIEGIQNTFIQRHGTVEFSDQAWVIRVEGNAFDILLEDLPWEISTIILPWLDSLIFVEWQQE